MDKPILSKSTYIRSLQCLKSLYLHKKRPFLRDRLSPEQRVRFERGSDVGLMARDLYPGGLDCSQKSPMQYARAIELTQQAIENGVTVLYEAAFLADGILIYLDILAREGDAGHAVEVKSSAALSQTYLEDAALQYYVLLAAGIELQRFSLVHVDTSYEWEDPPLPGDYFAHVDVTEEVMAMQDGVKVRIRDAKAVLDAGSSPAIGVGRHCSQPYPCDFRGHCWKKEQRPGIADIPGTTWDEREEWMSTYQGDLAALASDETRDPDIRARASALLNGSVYRSGMEPLPNGLLRAGTWLVDIAFSRPAIPLAPGQRPYAPLPFAAALADGGGGRNEEFLATDPSRAAEQVASFLAERLAKAELIVTWDKVQAGIIRSSVGAERQIIVLEELYGEHFFFPSHPEPADLSELGVLAGIRGSRYSRITDSHSYMMHWLGKGKDDWVPELAMEHCKTNLRILARLLQEMGASAPDVDK